MPFFSHFTTFTVNLTLFYGFISNILIQMPDWVIPVKTAVVFYRHSSVNCYLNRSVLWSASWWKKYSQWQKQFSRRVSQEDRRSIYNIIIISSSRWRCGLAIHSRPCSIFAVFTVDVACLDRFGVINPYSPLDIVYILFMYFLQTLNLTHIKYT